MRRVAVRASISRARKSDTPGRKVLDDGARRGQQADTAGPMAHAPDSLRRAIHSPRTPFVLIIGGDSLQDGLHDVHAAGSRRQTADSRRRTADNGRQPGLGTPYD